jgi:hypothetical protein
MRGISWETGGGKEKTNLFWWIDYLAWARDLGKDCNIDFLDCKL